MIETTSHEAQDSTSEESSESFSPEAGGTSVSFRPGPSRFLLEFERKPWWLAPGAIVMVPLLVMLVAAWAIPERIGSEDPESGTGLPMFGVTRSSPSRNSTALEDGESEQGDAVPDYAAPPSSSSRRAPREESARPARRGFSPVREREESPEMPSPVQMAPPPPSVAPEPPEPEPEPPIARSNGARGGRALSVVSRPEEPESESDSEPSVEPSEAAAQPDENPEGTPTTDVNSDAAPAQPEGEADQNQER